MNFRQRFAWILVMLYISATMATVYYLFEINEKYNQFAVQHLNTHHTDNGQQDHLVKPIFVVNNIHPAKHKHVTEVEIRNRIKGDASDSNAHPKSMKEIHVDVETDSKPLWHHVIDVPFMLWGCVLMLPYLQTFFMLLACTRTNPTLSVAYRWPCVVYFKLQNLTRGSHQKHFNSSIALHRGSIIIDT